MSGVDFDVSNTRLNPYFLAVYFHVLGAINQQASERAWRLVANKQDGRVSLPQAMSQMMPDPTRMAHSTCILLDEPTSALDEAATSRVEDVIRAQCGRGTAVILVTHDLAQARRLASRRFVMEHGLLKPEVEGQK